MKFFFCVNWCGLKKGKGTKMVLMLRSVNLDHLCSTNVESKYDVVEFMQLIISIYSLHMTNPA